ncbi:hypothetical protein GCM10027517_07700 [Phycicoccus ginsengisoli]
MSRIGCAQSIPARDTNRLPGGPSRRGLPACLSHLAILGSYQAQLLWRVGYPRVTNGVKTAKGLPTDAQEVMWHGIGVRPRPDSSFR